VSFTPTFALAQIALLVLAGLVAGLALRRTPAHVRHDLWLLVIAGAIIVSFSGLLLPAVFFKAPAALASLLRSPSTTGGAVVLALVWVGGALVAVIRQVPGFRVLRRIGRHATPLCRPDAAAVLTAARHLAGVSRPVRLLVSDEVRVPATWGVRRPVVALPAAASLWCAERLRVVLLHELLHVRRHDVLVEWLLEAVTIAFWFHPAVWLAAGRLRLERERACDEAVLHAGGTRASDYCAHLVEIMRAAATPPSGVVVAPGMAAPATLESRVRALLVAPPPQRFRLRTVVLVAGALAICGLGVLTPCLHVP